MNLPNKLTLARILVIPVMIIVHYIPFLNSSNLFLGLTLANLINFAIFLIASCTDFVDGYLARKHNLVTTFGKFADPLADKLLVMTAMLIFMDQGVMPTWMVIVILSREFIVTGIRLVAVQTGKVIAASNMGKIKTISTMIGLVILFLAGLHSVVYYIGIGTMIVATIITVVSGIDYFMKNKEIVLESV